MKLVYKSENGTIDSIKIDSANNRKMKSITFKHRIYNQNNFVYGSWSFLLYDLTFSREYCYIFYHEIHKSN